MNLIVQISQTNETKRYRYADDAASESAHELKGELFSACLKEYGRCISKMYVDVSDGGRIHIGWVFEKKMKYDDSHETFICHTWIAVLTERHKYQDLSRIK